MGSLGDRLKYIRVSANLSQKDMGFELGCTHGTISNYETNTRTPSYDDIVKINEVVSLIIGDQLFFILTGMKPKEYLTSIKIESNYLDKTEVFQKLGEWLENMEFQNEIKIKGKVTPLVSSFAKQFNASSSNGNTIDAKAG